MIEVPHLEWHITHNCNLSCQGCSHFTNHGHDWFAEIETLKEWYSYWNKRISPHTIAILGGEPLLHKNVIDIIYLTREMWNQPLESSIKLIYPRYEIVTNGILIDEEKHKDLPKALKDTDCVLSVSIHSNKNISNNKSIPPIIRWDNFNLIVLFSILIYLIFYTRECIWINFINCFFLNIFCNFWFF